MMPRLGGLDAIERILALGPVPILVVTERPREGGMDMTFEALSRGAVDLIPRSSTGSGEAAAKALRDRIRIISRIKVIRPRPSTVSGGPDKIALERVYSVVGIGASTGGPACLGTLIKDLPSDFPVPVVIVQHMPEDFLPGFEAWMRRHTGKSVRVAVAGAQLIPGTVYLAGPKCDLVVTSKGTLDCITPDGDSLHVPSVDRLFSSIATIYGPAAVGILLTGRGNDGARGLLSMRSRGALTIAQDEASSVVYGMPRVAAEIGAASHVLSLAATSALLRRIGAAIKPARPAPSSAGTAPVGRAAGAPTGGPATAPAPKASDRKSGKRVLVVDDSPLVLEAVRGGGGSAP